MSFPQSEMNSLEISQVPVSEAADLLDVHPSRVRAMIAQGRLDARKLGGRWFVDRRSIESRRAQPHADGRPFSEANAWALLCLVEGKEPNWVSKWELSRLRRRLREEGIEKLAPRLWKRARKQQLRAHPAFLPKLRNDPRLRRSGVSAAVEHGVDIVEPGEFEAYVADSNLERVVEDHYLEPSPNPNVLLHVARAKWIERSANDSMRSAVAALDLCEADDERSRRAGMEHLAALSVRWRRNDDDRNP